MLPTKTWMASAMSLLSYNRQRDFVRVVRVNRCQCCVWSLALYIEYKCIPNGQFDHPNQHGKFKGVRWQVIALLHVSDQDVPKLSSSHVTIEETVACVTEVLPQLLVKSLSNEGVSNEEANSKSMLSTNMGCCSLECIMDLLLLKKQKPNKEREKIWYPSTK